MSRKEPNPPQPVGVVKPAPPPSPPPVNRESVTLTDGSPVTPDHREINPATGQQKAYVVLSAEERAKGYARPVRRTYRHVGTAPPEYSLRDLTSEEHERYGKFGYIKYETYPDSPEIAAVGKYWTQAELDKINTGCGATTTMGQTLAETYARDPSFYGGTFCCACNTHYPVDEFVWLDNPDQRVGS